MPGQFGAPKPQNDGIPKPKKLREVPGYLARRIKGFLSRLFYIVTLVWEASPAILFLLAFLCLLDGLLPIGGAYIAKFLLDEIAGLISEGLTATGSLATDLFVRLRPVLLLFLLEFLYLFLRRILTRVNTTANTIAGELVVHHIKMKIIGKAKTVDQRSFDDPVFYEKLENANREAGHRPISILNSTFHVISAIIGAVSFVAVLLTLNPWAPLIIVLASIPGAVVNYHFRNSSFRYLRRHSKERRQMDYYSSVMTNKDHAKEIRLHGLGDTFTEKYEGVFRKYFAGLKRLTLREGIISVLVGLVSILANSLLFVYVAYTVIYHGGRIGDYSLYTGALNSITSYVTTIITSTATIYEGTLFIENMIDFMREPVTIVPSVAEPRIPEKGGAHTLELRGVCFRYPGSDHDVIHDVDLTLKSGESVVLVGLNGAGKTTLLKLMMRLYDPTAGVILLDGHDLREYDTDALYDLYGIIFQDFGKYAETVRENIRFGDIRRPYREEEIVRAAEQGNADEFIGRLKKGYDTPLTRMFEEDGIELSGGQWQKLSIARAFYKQSDILIMDEPTAALDAIAEQEVFSEFQQLSAGKISVFVSHRLSSATTAGQIVVLEGGRVIEQGTHRELMARGGRYSVLFTTQAQHYIAER